MATPTARAVTTSTAITTPSQNTFYVVDNDASPTTLTISGTTSASVSSVDIDCYAGGTPKTLASTVPVTSDSFTTIVPDLSVLEDGVCTLRAIPSGSAPSDLSPYTGPTIGVGERDTATVGTGPNTGQVYDYHLWAPQLTAAFDYHSLGKCGLFDGFLFDAALAVTTTDFFCNEGLLGQNAPSAPTRSEIQIGGVNAYAPDTAEGISPSATGLPALSYSYSVDAATGNLVIHETDPLVTCSPDTSYPPDSTKCASFVSAGVTDNRTIAQDHDGHISWVTDAFTSTDGQAHTLDLLWDQNQHFYGSGGGDASQVEYEFPGQSTYSTHAVNDAVSLPSSPGTILIRMHGAADGDIDTGQGAIVYDRPATAATFTQVDSSDSEFTLHQTGTVPAGGSTTFRAAFVQDYLAANVASLAQTASSSFLNTVAVSKAGTGNGTVTSSPGGISCGSTCSHAYPVETSVTLTATAATGSTFTGWSGACGGTATCTVSTNAAAAVTATFNVTAEKLTVAKKGDGKGTVSSYPTGINCGRACSQSFDYGTPMIMRAKAAKGSSFAGWSGACKSKSAGCTFLMNAAKSLKATFVKNCTVPRLTGKSLKTAKRALKSHDCSLGRVKYAFSSRVKRGRVISEKPRAGRHLKHGAKVGLVLAR